MSVLEGTRDIMPCIGVEPVLPCLQLGSGCLPHLTLEPEPSKNMDLDQHIDLDPETKKHLQTLDNIRLIFM